MEDYTQHPLMFKRFAHVLDKDVVQRVYKHYARAERSNKVQRMDVECNYLFVCTKMLGDKYANRYTQKQIMLSLDRRPNGNWKYYNMIKRHLTKINESLIYRMKFFQIVRDLASIENYRIRMLKKRFNAEDMENLKILDYDSYYPTEEEIMEQRRIESERQYRRNNTHQYKRKTYL